MTDQNRVMLSEDIAFLMYKQTIHSKEVLTLEEAADFLGIMENSLRELLDQSEIPYYMPIEGTIFLKRTELEQWIFSKRQFGPVDTFNPYGNDSEIELSI